MILRKDDLTVTISTGGRASRLSRMIRDHMVRHIEHADSASVLVIGTSHEQLSIDRREPYHLVGQRLERTGQDADAARRRPGVTLLNTCNRIELHAIVSDKADLTGLLARVLGFDQLRPEEYYVRRQYDAFAHSAMLSAGLFSAIPGGVSHRFPGERVTAVRGARRLGARHNAGMGLYSASRIQGDP